MASMSEEERALFPLRTVSSVVELFKLFLTRSDQPDLALMSIISGLVENTLTCHLPAAILSGKSGIIVSVEESQSESNNKPPLSTTNKEEGFPEVDLDIVEALYAKFRAVVRSSVELENHGRPRKATREMVKKVSDVIWNTLTRSYYKDRAHLQSLYSYLTGILFFVTFSSFQHYLFCYMIYREQVGLLWSCIGCSGWLPSFGF